MWMTGVWLGFTILAAFHVLLWLRGVSGSGVMSSSAVGFPAVAVGVAVPCLPGRQTCLLLAGPRCWRSPCRTGVSRPGPPSRFPGLSGRADTARFWTLMSLMIAPPMGE